MNVAHFDCPDNAPYEQGADRYEGNLLARGCVFQEEDGSLVAGEHIKIDLVDSLWVHCGGMGTSIKLAIH
jgi:hypothetical protein